MIPLLQVHIKFSIWKITFKLMLHIFTNSRHIIISIPYLPWVNSYLLTFWKKIVYFKHNTVIFCVNFEIWLLREACVYNNIYNILKVIATDNLYYFQGQIPTFSIQTTINNSYVSQCRLPQATDMAKVNEYVLSTLFYENNWVNS